MKKFEFSKMLFTFFNFSLIYCSINIINIKFKLKKESIIINEFYLKNVIKLEPFLWRKQHARG